MKKFLNKNTGLVEDVTNEKLIEQYEKYNNIYELVGGETNNEPTLKELKEKADALGIEYKAKVTKAELLELIANTETE
jgi:hypothetical protein